MHRSIAVAVDLGVGLGRRTVADWVRNVALARRYDARQLGACWKWEHTFGLPVCGDLRQSVKSYDDESFCSLRRGTVHREPIQSRAGYPDPAGRRYARGLDSRGARAAQNLRADAPPVGDKYGGMEGAGNGEHQAEVPGGAAATRRCDRMAVAAASARAARRHAPLRTGMRFGRRLLSRLFSISGTLMPRSSASIHPPRLAHHL